MKKILTLLFVLSAIFVKSQDTLFTNSGQKTIPCTITKILDNKIFYSQKNVSKEISMSSVTKYSLGKAQFSNGSIIRDFDGQIYNNSTSIVSRRCSVIKPSGSRCENKTSNSSGVCDKH